MCFVNLKKEIIDSDFDRFLLKACNSLTYSIFLNNERSYSYEVS